MVDDEVETVLRDADQLKVVLDVVVVGLLDYVQTSFSETYKQLKDSTSCHKHLEFFLFSNIVTLWGAVSTRAARLGMSC